MHKWIEFHQAETESAGIQNEIMQSIKVVSLLTLYPFNYYLGDNIWPTVARTGGSIRRMH